MSDPDLDSAETPSGSPPTAGTGSPAILEKVRELLGEGPSSGSALAKRLGVQKCRLPEDRAARTAAEGPYSQENIDRLVRAAFAQWFEKYPDLKRQLKEQGQS